MSCTANQPKDFWKNELKEFSIKNGPEGSRSAESGPMLLDVLEGYLKYEVNLLMLMNGIFLDYYLHVN